MGIEYLHSNKWGGFFILIFLETFGNKSLLVNISKRLLVISAEGHYRTVFTSFVTNKCLLEKSFLLPPSFSTGQAGWEVGSTAVTRSAFLSLHSMVILWSALILSCSTTCPAHVVPGQQVFVLLCP